MNDTQKNWEKEWNEKYVPMIRAFGHVNFAHSTEISIQEFIEQKIAAAYERGKAEERAKVREVVEGKIPTRNTFLRVVTSEDWESKSPKTLIAMGYVKAITDILTALTPPEAPANEHKEKRNRLTDISEEEAAVLIASGKVVKVNCMNDTNKEWEEFKAKCEVINDSLWYVNPSGITKLLETTRREERAKMREVVEGMKRNQNTSMFGGEDVAENWKLQKIGYNTALTDLLTTLEESEDKE